MSKNKHLGSFAQRLLDTVRVCPQCGQHYLTTNKLQKYCSDRCRVNTFRRTHLPEDHPNARKPE
jgi:hypothetical protein